MTTRLHGDPRLCPVAAPVRTVVHKCERVVRAGQLMCAAHWRQVPKDLQREVYRTWRQWQRTPEDDVWQEYLTAREAALASVGHVDG